MADGAGWSRRRKAAKARAKGKTRTSYRVGGTGLYADRLRSLSAVAHEVPACLAELAALLTPQLADFLRGAAPGAFDGPEYQFNAGAPLPSVRTAIPTADWVWRVVRWPAEVRSRPGEVEGLRWETPPEVVQLNEAVAAWASKWNLARDGAGGWVLATVGRTLHRWATHGELLPRTHFQGLPWGGYVAEWRGTSTRGRWTPERLRPFTPATGYRARAKNAEVAARELLTVEAPHHLVALARWQVGGAGAPTVARLWAKLEGRASAPADNVVTQKLRALALRLDLPARPRAHPGRRPG